MTFSNLQWEPKSKREARRQEMFTFVEQWQRSGETQRSWCDMHGMHLAKFQYWVRKYRDTQTPQDHPTDFVDLVPPPREQIVTTLEIHFPSGAFVKLPASELDLVRQLVR
jgi:hypothetical protein